MVRLESLADFLDNAVSLLVGEAGAERELSEVATYTDTGGDNHGLFVSGERRAVELGGIHIGDVLTILTVLVVLLNDLVEERGEGGVGVVRASVTTDA